MQKPDHGPDRRPAPVAPYPMPFVRVELAVLSIVEGSLAVLLGQRAQAPHAGQWALPGGVLRIDLDEDLEAAAQRVANERLGAPLPFIRQLTLLSISFTKKVSANIWNRLDILDLSL